MDIDLIAYNLLTMSKKYHSQIILELLILTVFLNKIYV